MKNYENPLVLGMLNPNKLNLKELKTKLNQKDERTVKIWLKQRSIPLKKEGRESTVFEWRVDLARQLEMVEELMIKYPLEWHKLYEDASTDPLMVRAVFAVYNSKPQTKKSNRNNNNRNFK